MTVFLAAVATASVLGWRWVAVLPSAKMEAARVVLTIAAVGSAIAIAIIWRTEPRKSRRGSAGACA